MSNEIRAELPENICKTMKVIAIMEGRNFSEFISEILTAWVTEHHPNVLANLARKKTK